MNPTTGFRSTPTIITNIWELCCPFMYSTPTYAAYRGFVSYETSFFEREDDPTIFTSYTNIESFYLHDFIRIISGPKSTSLDTIVGRTEKKLKVLLSDGDLITILPKKIVVIGINQDLHPGVVIPEDLSYRAYR